ncbi:MAG: hypothetical protein K6C08_10305 [Oscillospiraceae bacterium]|nr:hypothetical protein [Oscillospiraceae bacterium]
MIDWKKKLTSRKFWLAVVGLVSGLMVAFRVDAETVESVSGIIMSAASVIAYIIGEGMADAANANSTIILPQMEEQTEEVVAE